MMINWNKVDQAIIDGYIKEVVHPSGELRLYAYTMKAQIDWHFPLEVRQCRGLITDSQRKIVSRPFEKFFSYEQLDGQLPNGEYDVYTKLDGSLGISYWMDGQPYVATKGSFISEQSDVGTQMIQEWYMRGCNFDQSLTYLFEIIYPQNRIVVDYKGERMLVLLAVIDTSTGKEMPLPNWYPHHAPKHKVEDVKALRMKNIENAEGFVLRYRTGERVKIKFDEYKKLHRLVTGLNPRHIWESLRDGTEWRDRAMKLPDEFSEWAHGVERGLRLRYEAIERHAQKQLRTFPTRKETAEYILQCDNPPVLFAMLDGKDYAPIIWKELKPDRTEVFRRDGE